MTHMLENVRSAPLDLEATCFKSMESYVYTREALCTLRGKIYAFHGTSIHAMSRLVKDGRTPGSSFSVERCRFYYFKAVHDGDAVEEFDEFNAEPARCDMLEEESRLYFVQAYDGACIYAGLNGRFHAFAAALDLDFSDLKIYSPLYDISGRGHLDWDEWQRWGTLRETGLDRELVEKAFADSRKYRGVVLAIKSCVAGFWEEQSGDGDDDYYTELAEGLKLDAIEAVVPVGDEEKERLCTPQAT